MQLRAINRIVSFKSASLGALAAILMLLGCSKPTQSESQPFIDWVSRHAVILESPTASLFGDQLISFGDMIGPARVVGLGESRHDTREQLQMKMTFIKHLIAELGFRAVILEESFTHVEPLDRYVATGEGDPRELMNNLAGWYIWDSEEMLECIEWLRSYNADRGLEQRIRIFGMDITAPADGVRAVLEFLDAAGVKSGLTEESLGLDLHRGDMWPATWQRYQALTGERKRELGDNYEALLGIVRANAAALTAHSSPEAYDRIVLLSEIASSAHALFSSSGRENGGAVREAGMVHTALWILNRRIPGEKAVIWAHNLHVARSWFRMPGLAEGRLEPMGIQLSKKLGGAYLTVGAAFGSGVYPATLPPGERRFDTAPDSVLDGALARAGPAHFIIDLRGAAQDSDAAEWLRRERECIAQDAQAVMIPGAAFDLVYFVRTISRAQPTPLALQKFQSLGQ